jgi:hypothetical protein
MSAIRRSGLALTSGSGAALTGDGRRSTSVRSAAGMAGSTGAGPSERRNTNTAR